MPRLADSDNTLYRKWLLATNPMTNPPFLKDSNNQLLRKIALTLCESMGVSQFDDRYPRQMDSDNRLLRKICLLQGNVIPTPPQPPVPPVPPEEFVIEDLSADSVSQGNDTDVLIWPAVTGLQATGVGGATARFILNGKNSLPIMRFNGTTSTMRTVSFGAAAVQTFSVYAVVKLNVVDVGQRLFSGIIEGGVDGNRVVFRADSSPQLLVYAGNPGFLFIDDADTDWHIIGVEFNGAASRVRIDGGPIVDIGANPGLAGMTGLCLSGDYTGDIEPASMDLAQIKIKSVALENEVFDAMNAKWAVY